ncbi:hypothetical protein [Rhodococcus sp. BS-15]|uniref:hypothetical protein n=1 Tax=Rhodococcus sp. BS-15 TaxID=1304954 RepID=UPI000FFC806B|nr:hypothetical protein [Rhodococcus sp. BS-15]
MSSAPDRAALDSEIGSVFCAANTMSPSSANHRAGSPSSQDNMASNRSGAELQDPTSTALFCTDVTCTVAKG